MLEQVQNILNNVELPLDKKAELIDLIIGDNPVPDALPNIIKDWIQRQALKAIVDNGGRGFIAAATGVGKTRIAILYAQMLYKVNKNVRILIAVPTEKLRDTGWKEEFKKWKATKIYTNNVRTECYASLSKIRGYTKENPIDYFIADEAHNFTEANSTFFENNCVKHIVALSATPSNDSTKRDILNNLGLNVVYELKLDLAVKLKLVAPYEVIIVQTRLDAKDAYIKAGNKEKVFYQTEQANYNYLDNKAKRMLYSGDGKLAKFALLARMRFVYNLRSKTIAAEKLMNLIPKHERTLVFCGSIEQANKLAESNASLQRDAPDEDYAAPHTFHSKVDDTYYNLFKESKINTLTCVNSLNEGHNIPLVDNALIVQLNSNDLNFIQRIGRTVRYRKGHVAKVIIVCCIGTQDEEWVKKATSSLDQSKIKKVLFDNILNGEAI